MRRSSRLILVLGVVLAVVAFLGILQVLGGGAGGSGAKEGPAVYATKDIPFGGLVQASDVELKTIPLDQRDPNAIGDTGLVVGRTVTTNVVAGKQLLTSDFTVEAGAAPLAQNLGAGLRAVAVEVDAVDGVGSLVQVGDHVDLVVAFDRKNFVVKTDPKVPLSPMLDTQATTVKTLVQNLQVVGIQSSAPATDSNAAPTTGKQIVILAVTPDQAEVIKFAQLEGSITLALRSPKDYLDANGQPIVPTVTKTKGIVLKSLLDQYGVLVPELIKVLGAP